MRPGAWRGVGRLAPRRPASPQTMVLHGVGCRCVSHSAHRLAIRGGPTAAALLTDLAHRCAVPTERFDWVATPPPARMSLSLEPWHRTRCALLGNSIGCGAAHWTPPGRRRTGVPDCVRTALDVLIALRDDAPVRGDARLPTCGRWTPPLHGGDAGDLHAANGVGRSRRLRPPIVDAANGSPDRGP